MASRHAWHAFGVDVDAWLDRAALLVEGRPTSRAKALVVSERARRNALTFRPETGRELALAAIQLARDVGDVEIEAHSLVTLGSARVTLGDAQGVQDLEVALELVGRRGTVAGRAMTNLGWAYHTTGDLLRSNLLTVEGIELAEREGDIQGVWFTRTNLVNLEQLLGRWDEALRLDRPLLLRATGRAACASPRPIPARAHPRGTRPWRRGDGGDRRRARGHADRRRRRPADVAGPEPDTEGSLGGSVESQTRTPRLAS